MINITAFYYSKTSCFTFLEGISFTLSRYLNEGKTTCFTVMIYSDIKRSNITLVNKQTIKWLKEKVILS